MNFRNIDINHGYGRVIKHILFWIFYFFGVLALNTPIIKVLNISFMEASLETIWFLPTDMIATYLTIYLFLPAYLAKRKLTKFVFQNLTTMIGALLVNRLLTIYVYVPLFHPEYIGKVDFFKFDIFVGIISVYFIVTLAVTFKLAQYFYKEKQEKINLEKQNLISELALLRTQINPHFLFNTLNNIDTLIYSQPEKASELLVRLSDIMRYMLYESSIEKVPLEKEIHYLKDIIQLYSLRIKNLDFIEFSVVGEATNLQISPMIFIPFVENAFKHGDKNCESPGISIQIQLLTSEVSFFVSNKIPAVPTEKDGQGGIGLYNVKRRLELLYRNKFNLSIMKSEEKFEVMLNIDL